MVCSTPEGIEAATTHAGYPCWHWGLECSTPEGIEAATTVPARVGEAAHGARVLNARGHRSGDDKRLGLAAAAVVDVLNARGHRSGDDNSTTFGWPANLECSTPEGIEAATTSPYHPVCRGSDRCSTPEGIEAATTVRTVPDRRTRLVLNARGHRSGDDHPNPRAPTRPGDPCSTPEGIEAATTLTEAHYAASRAVCSTPEGIEAATTLPSRDDAPGAARVLNARGHRSGDDRRGHLTPRSEQRSAQRPRASKRRRRPLPLSGSRGGVCSTPEGIEAATTTRQPRGAR